MKFIFRFLILLFLISPLQSFADDSPLADKEAPDREYTLRATMLGYFDESGARNPVLRAQKGETVKITIINGEPLTHDIALEKAGIISETLTQTDETTSIEFVAKESDIYFCSIPGHRLAGMWGKFEVVEGPVEEEKAIAGELPQKDGKEINLNFEQGTLQAGRPLGRLLKKDLYLKTRRPFITKTPRSGWRDSISSPVAGPRITPPQAP